MDFGNTENRGRERGRPAKPGRVITLTVKLREGEHDEILARLARLERGQRSAYVRRVLAGASVEVLEGSRPRESAGLTAALDGMFDDEEF